MERIWDVIVVGGGLAGLMAGATANRAGASTLVVEAHRPGGRARTVIREGHVLNMGAHAFFNGGPGAEVLRTLGIEPQGAAPPLRRFRASAGGRQHVLPTNPATLLRTTLLGRRSKAQFAALQARLLRLRPASLVGLSTADWMASSGLRDDTGLLLRALLRWTTYASNFDGLAADAAVGHLQTATRAGVTYLDGGWDQLVGRLAAMVEVRPGAKVTGVDGRAGQLEVATADAALRARRVVLAPGTPSATRVLLPADPGWGDLGEPVTAACLDVGTRSMPERGYLVGIDEPLYVTVQSPPARQAPAGHAVVSAIRYGAEEATEDRAALEAHMAAAGVSVGDAPVQRFLARMVVAGSSPLADTGGLPGRPSITASGLAGVYLAGDWIGPDGLLADAALASGHRAGLAAVRDLGRSSIMTA